VFGNIYRKNRESESVGPVKWTNTVIVSRLFGTPRPRCNSLGNSVDTFEFEIRKYVSSRCRETTGSIFRYVRYRNNIVHVRKPSRIVRVFTKKNTIAFLSRSQFLFVKNNVTLFTFKYFAIRNGAHCRALSLTVDARGFRFNRSTVNAIYSITNRTAEYV